MRMIAAASLAGSLMAAQLWPQLFPAERIDTAGGYTAYAGSGDADGDGLADLIAQGGNGGLLILRGAASGGFLPPQLLEGIAYSLSEDTGDVNGDDIPDLIFTDFDAITVLPGLGGMQFGAPVVTPIDTLTLFPLLGDLNEDGHVDIVLRPFFGDQSTHRIAFGQIDGSFVPGPVVATGGIYKSRELRDINADGVLDIVGALTGGNGKVKTTVLLGTGGGTFSTPIKSIVSGVGFTCDDMAIADMDLDGELDMAVLVSTFLNELSVVLMRGLGDGKFVVAGGLATPPEDGQVEAGDMDGDGLPDLVFGGNLATEDGAEGVIHVWRNTGGFTFESLPRALVGGVPTTLILLDSDRDGVTDVVVGHQPFIFPTPPGPPQVGGATGNETPISNGAAGADVGAPSGLTTGNTDFSVIRGRGDGGFASAGQVLTGAPVETVVTADVNADGLVDLLTCGQLGAARLQFSAGNGDGSFGAALDVEGVAPTEQLLASDVDGDGLLDLVLESAGGLVVQRGAGVPDVAGAPVFEAPLVIGPAGIDALAVTDLDADGVADIVAVHGATQSLDVHTGVGDGTFLSAVSWNCGMSATALAVADVTADGRPDLLLGSATDSKLVVLVAQAGGFLAPLVTDLGVPRDRIATADIDGDGLLDAVLAGSGSVGVTQLHGLGDGSFTIVDVLPTIGPASALLLADVTGDQRPDLLAVHRDAKALSARPGLAGGAFGALAHFSTAIAPAGAGVSDFDGDGLLDVAVGCLDNSIWILVNQQSEWTDLGGALAASFGTPQLEASGPLTAGQSVSMLASGVPTSALGVLILGFGTSYLPYAGGTIVPTPDLVAPLQFGVPISNTWPTGVAPGMSVCVQAWFATPGASGTELSATRALLAQTP